MNKTRRKAVHDLCVELDKIESSLTSLLQEEDDYRDNMPESFTETERYSDSEEASDALSSAIDSVAEAKDSLVNIL